MGNMYKCPSCDFVGKLGQLTNHLRENSEHWMVHCQECKTSIVTKKDLRRHEENTGHNTGLSSSDIVNVQKTTRFSKKIPTQPRKETTTTKKLIVKSATKKRLMELGISEKFSHQLARGRNMTDIKNLDDSQIATLLGISQDDSRSIISKLPVRKAARSESTPGAGLKWREDVLLRVMNAHNIDESQRDDFLRHAVPFDIPKNNYLKKSKLEAAALAWNERENNDVHEIKSDDEPDNKEDSTRDGVDADQNSETYQLRGMTISNFKGFREDEQQFIPIRPLTLVFGPNNGGKSSVLKSFSSLPQTIAKRKLLEGDYDWSPNGIWFDLGARPQILNNPDQPSFNIGFVFEVQNSLPDQSTQPNGRNIPVFHALKFAYNISDNIGILSEISYSKGDFEDELEEILSLEIQKTMGRKINMIPTTLKLVALETKSLLLNLAEKRSHLAAVIRKMQEILEELEEEGLFWRKRTYVCSECGRRGTNLASAKKHLKLHSRPAINIRKGGYLKGQQRKMIRHLLNVDLEGETKIPVSLVKLWKDAVEALKANFNQNSDVEPGSLEKILNYLQSQKVVEAMTFNPNEVGEETRGIFIRTLFSDRGNYWLENFEEPIGTEIENLNEIINQLRSILSEADYLGATRLSPQRTYSSRTGQQANQGVAGQRTLALLANDSKLQTWVNEGLSELIGLNVKVDRRHTTVTLADGTIREYPLDELDVRISRKDSPEDRLQLPDVGFGVSQLLPILTGIRSKGMLVVEEPESNLHPAAQQQLMSKIIQQISENQESAVLMETHSEHFLLEVLRAISDPECPLQDDDVAILYAYNTPESGTVVKRHKTTNGTLDERFPKAFTGDYGLSLI
jgi:predicted ATPase